MIGVVFAAARLEAAILRRSPAELGSLVTVPLFTLALVSIMTQAGRTDLAPYAVIGSTVIALWNMALKVSGDVIDNDRYNGTLELLVAAPTPLAVTVLGRTLMVTATSLLSLVESVAAARLLGVAVHVHHPVLLLLVLLTTMLAMVGTAIAMAGMFVLARSARTFQNSLSYPLYLLSGAIVPPDLLPRMLQPLTRIVFLSWSSDLVRDCLRSDPVKALPFRVTMVLGLGTAGYVVGVLILAAVLRRVRMTGSVSHA